MLYNSRQGINHNLKYIVIFSAFVFIYIWHLSPSIIYTFLTCLTISYILQPFVRSLANLLKISHEFASTIVFGIFITCLTSLLIIFIPILVYQLESLLLKMPSFKTSIETIALPFVIDTLRQYFGERISNNFVEMLDFYITQTELIIAGAIPDIIHYIASSFGILIIFFLLPITTFFFLKDWKKIVSNSQVILEQIGVPDVDELFLEINHLITAFIKAIVTVSVILFVLYSMALKLVGFEFAIMFGFLFGLANFIPLIGPIVVLTICMMVSLLNNGIDSQQLWIVLIYITISNLDDSFITPKIYSDKLDFHPLVTIFSILSCGNLLGLPGLFLAVPITGIIKIILRRILIFS
ncbi:MAG: AI-2E family transporter [Rickettsiaceae bacterium]|nr:AI-2E family transporter [Rickettsiaceae bacterium]